MPGIQPASPDAGWAGPAPGLRGGVSHPACCCGDWAHWPAWPGAEVGAAGSARQPEPTPGPDVGGPGNGSPAPACAAAGAWGPECWVGAAGGGANPDGPDGPDGDATSVAGRAISVGGR